MVTKNLLKMYVLGFIVAMFLNMNTTCKKDDNPVEPAEVTPPANETKEMTNLSDSLISAFKSIDKTRILNCVSDECKATLQEELNNTTADIAAFGSALEKRTLIYSSELYAEYEVEVNGQKYNVAYANCGDSKWKVVRF